MENFENTIEFTAFEGFYKSDMVKGHRMNAIIENQSEELRYLLENKSLETPRQKENTIKRKERRTRKQSIHDMLLKEEARLQEEALKEEIINQQIEDMLDEHYGKDRKQKSIVLDCEILSGEENQ